MSDFGERRRGSGHLLDSSELPSANCVCCRAQNSADIIRGFDSEEQPAVNNHCRECLLVGRVDWLKAHRR